MATLGRWKQSKRGKGRFARKALFLTSASLTEIAGRAGMFPSNITTINAKEKIRPRELTAAIRVKARNATLAGRKRTSKRQKLCFFSEQQKQMHMRDFSPVIKIIAAGWWRSNLIKDRYNGRFTSFFDAVKEYVSSQLDYFNPKAATINGKPPVLSDWIKGGARIFCKNTYFNEKRAIKKVDLEKLAMENALEPKSYVPSSVKSFLRKCGLDIAQVTEMGFDDIRKMLLQISENRETGLTERQKKFVRLRLEDRTLSEIAKRFGLRSRSNWHKIEGKITSKIKARLQKL